MEDMEDRDNEATNHGEGNGAEEKATPNAAELKAVNGGRNVPDAAQELLYLRAEFDNYRKRMIREQESSIRFANERFMGEIIPIVDLLEMALSHSAALKAKNESKDVLNFINGIDLTHREFIQLLTRFGVEFFGAVGEKFDPQRHEAIAQKAADADKTGTVLEVLQRGCLLHGRLLKPAKVVVAEGEAP